MKFVLTPLPFNLNALEPYLSREQLYYHYERHHRGYLEKLDAALKDQPETRALPLEEIVKTTKGKVFNFAAQLWNHEFLWQSLSPRKVELPDSEFGELLSSSFGGVDGFNEVFSKVAEEEFGSGWAWLVYDPKAKKLAVTSTDDAKNPLPTNVEPLLTLDVWEHAYYLDYKNDRKSYIGKFLEHMINWDFAAANLSKCLGSSRKRELV